MRIRGLFILFMLTFSLSAQQPSIRTRELEKQRKELLVEIESINRLLNENKKSIRSILNNLDLILQQIDARKRLITVLEKEIQALDEEIQFKELQVKKLDKDLQQKKNNYAVSVQKMYQQKTNQGPLLFVLSADNPAQSFRRILYLKEYADWRKQQADEIVGRQQKIAIEKQALLADMQVKKELAETKKIEEGYLHKEENTRKTEIAGLQKNAKNLQIEIDKKKKQAAALDREITKIIAGEIAKSNQAAKADPQTERKAETEGGYAMTKEEQRLSSNFAENKGKLPFPLKGNYKIVSRFGKQQYADLRGVYIDNKDIKIKTIAGNNAKAVFDGEVNSIIITPGQPLTVLIQHGNYFTMYSGLEQLFVKKGDKVKTGQDIGRIYTDRGGSDETILSFGLTKDRVVQNPELWLIR